ncbi:HlyD family type I secretion periplasmic adaptor subunit [Kistimonas asteriae]|uniref:HlyD family type I secretion periplasmic adaptor subunit n=1 Tax=Kistimonas asteriae TaxID=517724 RepID=UPI001BAC6A91|nr:HlyD family type I secretion periplasmic adaptor subunit [Kistimonas asteriae]
MQQLPSGQSSDNQDPLSHWQEVSQADVQLITRGSRPLLMSIGLFIICFIVWAAWCEVDEVTRGEGKVIPSSQVQDVQNMEGGIIEKILVKEGDLVEQGQVLMLMDDTRFSASHQGQLANQYALMARKVRLQAEVEGSRPVMPVPLKVQVPELAESELELYQFRRQELASTLGIYQQQLIQQEKQQSETRAEIAMLQQRHASLDEELKLSQDLAKEGAVSRVEVLRLKRQVSDTRGEQRIAEENFSRILAAQAETQQRIREAELAFTNKARMELNETLALLHELFAKEAAASDQVERTQVRAPMKGVVKQILVNTEGGVVQPGMTMMELIPVDDTLEVEVKIRPRDIAFLHPGQKATIRFTAYDFTVHGGIDGVLTHLSADTIIDENTEHYYLARIKTDQNALGNADNSKPLIAGMVATVDILTGKKTLITYLLKPVLRAKQLAFTER